MIAPPDPAPGAFECLWPDETVSYVFATSHEEVVDVLDQLGDPGDVLIRPAVPGLMFTLSVPRARAAIMDEAVPELDPEGLSDAAYDQLWALRRHFLKQRQASGDHSWCPACAGEGTTFAWWREGADLTGETALEPCSRCGGTGLAEA
jgi:hypothetical protein